ncbi:MAG: DUF3822 family protein [Flavobacteriaceae bacterium]|nr:DUF3822 family protein [Flavobacteriaceae bacterium]
MTKPKNKKHALIKNNLELNTLKEYTLSIQLSLDGFSFCIYSDNLEGLIALNHHPFKTNSPTELLKEIEAVFDNSDLLKLNFKKVMVCHESNLSTLVPKSLFDKEKLATYLSYAVKTLENDFFDFDNLEILDSENVYIPYVNVNNFFIDKFGSFTYNHFSSILIQYLLSNTHATETEMFAHIGETHFEIIVIKKQKLLLYNTYVYTSKEDFIYYILYVAEQLGLDTNIFKLNLLGNINTHDALFSMAYSYVKNVSLYSFNLNYKVLFPLSENLKRKFFTLLQQH